MEKKKNSDLYCQELFFLLKHYLFYKYSLWTNKEFWLFLSFNIESRLILN